MHAEVQGADGKEAVDIVHRGIPFLASFPFDKLRFYVPAEMQDMKPMTNEWAPIMDDAWPTFAISGSPRRMWVQTIESPEEKQSRTSAPSLSPMRRTSCQGNQLPGL